MRAIALVLGACVLVASCAPGEPAKPGEGTLVSESYSFSDPAKHNQLKDELRAAGVPFTIEMYEGQEQIKWDARHAGRANAIRMKVFGPDLPAGRHISYDPQTQLRFKLWLKERDIPFQTVEKEGREYVLWDDNVDARVREWSLPLPPLH